MDLQENIRLAFQLIPLEFLNTLYMVFVSAFFALLMGLPLGLILYLTREGGLSPAPLVYRFVSGVVNIGRSIPFAILIVAVIPITRWIVGTSLGTTASIVPLTLAAAPFMARVIEGALKEVRVEVVEAAEAMGAGRKSIIFKVLFPESLPTIVGGFTLALVNLVGYSALAGLVGGGGLGKIAIQYGYQRFNGFLMIATLAVLVLLVEGIEYLGRSFVKSILKKRGVR